MFQCKYCFNGQNLDSEASDLSLNSAPSKMYDFGHAH